ncbi:MAG: transporter permease, partial [Tardiphaga sp.]|nr:transporter permease [Tardiphaga sp.]
MTKTLDTKAWLLVLPVVILVAFNAILPLMTVINYSLQDTFGNTHFSRNGVQWYAELLDPATEFGGRFFGALGRSIAYS